MDFGEYKTIRLLGKGGMSEVYEVECVRLGSRHALKLFTYEKDEPEVRERFLVEGRLLARFEHPRIVKVSDIGTVEKSRAPYLVMNLIQDERGVIRSLADVEPGTVDEETIGRWYDDIREGLAYIHAQGVIHRDLKLQNVLIGPDGHVVLTDFGVSKVIEKGDDNKTVVDAVRTLVKVREGRSLVMGSVGYMAPELELGVAASRQSDWYALGVIVYRLLTGTWCDARTDVVGTLETYDPVWKRIIPKLLHSNPNGRECLSYAEEKVKEQERMEMVQEERLSSACARGKAARHLLRGLAAVTVVMAGVIVYGVMLRGVERRETSLNRQMAAQASSEAERPAPQVVISSSQFEFDAFFAIPPEVKEDEQTDDEGDTIIPSREEVGSARIDLLVLTHPLFSRLRAGTLTVGQAVEELERMQESLSENNFDRWPNGYMQTGSDEPAAWLLSRAIERLRDLSDR